MSDSPAPEQALRHKPEQVTRIDDVGEFLVHALELEHESTAHYDQLADSMLVHHNQEVAALFQRLAQLSAEHAAEITKRAVGIELPEIAPCEFKWNCPGSPESSDCLETDVTYQMTARQALELALHNEGRGQAFYAEVAAASGDARVHRLAGEMAREEEAHVSLLVDLLRREPGDGATAAEDLDPPHMPE